MTMLAELVDGVIGVDTHRDTLTAAAVSHLGGVLAHTSTSADAAGYQRLPWSYLGSGYQSTGEAWLAASAATRAWEERRIAKEELRTMTMSAA
jgi:hypothetical protein